VGGTSAAGALGALVGLGSALGLRRRRRRAS
jgi:LPXTG-motif cell wall-anchored protein